jgi:hypothetical protein
MTSGGSAPARVRGGATAVAWLFALVALTAQIAFGALVVPDDAPDGRLAVASVGVMCGGGTTHHHPREPAGALCPLSVALVAPALVASPVVPPALRGLVWVARRVFPPSARAPPPARAHVGEPRAPPVG